MSTIKEMDQNNWVCYKFQDNSYYYGQIGYLDTTGVVHSKDNIQIANDNKNKLVRHGFGIYIYNDQTGQTRYQGQWAKDQKNGKGMLKFKDGTLYQGQFKDGFYNDNGTLNWPNGDKYDGRWKKGRMEGPGVFIRHDGLTLKGSFKNNYFIDEDNSLRNPYMTDKQYIQLKKRRKQIKKQYEKNQKIKTGYFERILLTQKNKIYEFIKKSNCNNRVMLLLSSEELGVTFLDIVQGIKESQSNIFIIDLRKAYKITAEQKYNYIKEIQEKTQNAIKNGGTLILSLDDSEVIKQFDLLFYPQIKQLYTTNGFNNTIWSPKDLKKSQIRKKIIGESQVNQKFCFFVWSKVKYSEEMKNEMLIEKLEKRFEAVLPFIKMDIVFIEKGKK